MSECCNYCKTEITISDSIEAVWKISLLNIEKQSNSKKKMAWFVQLVWKFIIIIQ